MTTSVGGGGAGVSGGAGAGVGTFIAPKLAKQTSNSSSFKRPPPPTAPPPDQLASGSSKMNSYSRLDIDNKDSPKSILSKKFARADSIHEHHFL
jgi:hypothetical protein